MKVANKVLIKQLRVMEHKRAIIGVLLLYGKEYAYLFFLQRSDVLFRAEREKALDDDVCVFVHHVVGVEAKPPVFQVLVFGRVVHLL